MREPGVFTVFCCGTAFNRERLEEVVANLASRMVGQKGLDWWINDGPGSDPKKPKEPDANGLARTPGLGHSRDREILFDEEPRGPLEKMKRAMRGMVPSVWGKMSGYGWNHNVEDTMKVILDGPLTYAKGVSGPTRRGTSNGFRFRRPRIFRINMVGWSRGAVTCHMLAQALYNEPRTQNIPVNIFAFDPVPGWKNDDKLEQYGMRYMPANVRRYTGIIMEDDRRAVMFKPIIIRADPFATAATGQKITIIPLPGEHDTAILWDASPVGRIGASLAEEFLDHYGTGFTREKFKKSPREYCELYAQVRMNLQDYRQMFGPGWARKNIHLNLGVKTFEKNFEKARKVPNNMRDNNYFINWHHARQFELAYNFQYNYMTGAGYGRTQQEIERYWNQIRNHGPLTYQSLVDLGYITDPNREAAPPPHA
jgi:hypothetical protein